MEGETNNSNLLSFKTCAAMTLSLPPYSMMGTDSALADSWTSGSDETWSYMKRGMYKLADKFSSLSQAAHEQVVLVSDTPTLFEHTMIEGYTQTIVFMYFYTRCMQMVGLI